MTTSTEIFSTRMVTPTGVGPGRVILEAGRIAAVEAGPAAPTGAEYWGEDLLIPGLIDIHTDNLEKHYQPRPGALWDSVGAALAHDGQCIAAGITTVLDSLSLHGQKDGLNRREALGPMIGGVDEAQAVGALKADHLLHLRCEVTNPELLSLLEPFAAHPRLKLLSVMDHTPGQRQTADIGRFAARMQAAGRPAEEIAEMVATRTATRDQSAAPENRRRVVAIARAHAIPLAAHDDATIDQVQEAADDGCVIAEFPVTRDAAAISRELGMLVAMGAPNFVRGASHSGNLSARETAETGLLDILASDYIPLSMLRAAFLLAEAPFGWPLAQAIATVTANPARSIGLSDRGAIAPGLRADLARISWAPGRWPVVKEVWREGARVA